MRRRRIAASNELPDDAGWFVIKAAARAAWLMMARRLALTRATFANVGLGKPVYDILQISS